MDDRTQDFHVHGTPEAVAQLFRGLEEARAQATAAPKRGHPNPGADAQSEEVMIGGRGARGGPGGPGVGGEGSGVEGGGGGGVWVGGSGTGGGEAGGGGLVAFGVRGAG